MNKDTSKTIFIGLWICTALVLFFHPLYGMEITVEEEHNYAGHIVVPLSLNINQEESPSCASLELKYNPSLLTFQRIQVKNVLTEQGKMLQFNEVKPGCIRIIIYGLNTEVLPSGTVASVCFQQKYFLSHI